MKKIIALLGILLLLVVACKPSETVTVQLTGAPKPIAVPKADEVGALLEQVKTETTAKNDLTQEIVVPINNKKGEVGDTVIFGVNFNQVNKLKGTYFARIMLIEGRDKSYNKIEVDKETMNGWLRNSQTEDFVLEEKESYYVPVIFIVGSEIKSGVKTAPGTYQYEVQFYSRPDPAFEKKLDKVVKSVYLTIE